MDMYHEFHRACQALDEARGILENSNAGPALTALKKMAAKLDKDDQWVAHMAITELVELFEAKTSAAGGDKENGRHAALNRSCQVRGCFSIV